MTQLTLENIPLPQTDSDRYRCYPADLSVQVDMISGRRVKEVRGIVQMISWSYDYMGDDLWRKVQAVLRRKEPITVGYLPDNADEMASGKFLVESLQSPTFAFADGGVPVWHNVAFTLREVRPHD